MENDIEEAVVVEATDERSDDSQVESVEPLDLDGGDDEEKFISQKELDRILQKRLKRQEDQKVFRLRPESL